MKKLGLFGLTIPEEYGGLGESLLTYALAVEEIARGWMSVSGIINTHFIVAHMIARHGTEEQKDYFLPRMAAGEIRGAFSMSEPGMGSDVSAIRTKAVPADGDGDDYVINGQKMWLTNGGTVQPGGGALPDRRRPRRAAPEHDHVPDREGAGLRGQPDGAGPDRAGEDREDGLQGRRHHRADPRRTSASPPTGCSAAAPARASTR